MFILNPIIDCGQNKNYNKPQTHLNFSDNWRLTMNAVMKIHYAIHCCYLSTTYKFLDLIKFFLLLLLLISVIK